MLFIILHIRNAAEDYFLEGEPLTDLPSSLHCLHGVLTMARTFQTYEGQSVLFLSFYGSSLLISISLLSFPLLILFHLIWISLSTHIKDLFLQSHWFVSNFRKKRIAFSQFHSSTWPGKISHNAQQHDLKKIWIMVATPAMLKESLQALHSGIIPSGV